MPCTRKVSAEGSSLFRSVTKLLQNCDAIIPLACRDFAGAGDRTIGDGVEVKGSGSLSIDNFTEFST